jgi:hypothetical protein
MAEDTEPSLTFGVEIEMFYVHEPSNFHQLTSTPKSTLQRNYAYRRRMYVASILRHEPPIGYRVPSIHGGVAVGESYQHRDNVVIAENYLSDYTQ